MTQQPASALVGPWGDIPRRQFDIYNIYIYIHTHPRNSDTAARKRIGGSLGGYYQWTILNIKHVYIHTHPRNNDAIARKRIGGSLGGYFDILVGRYD